MARQEPVALPAAAGGSWRQRLMEMLRRCCYVRGVVLDPGMKLSAAAASKCFVTQLVNMNEKLPLSPANCNSIAKNLLQVAIWHLLSFHPLRWGIAGNANEWLILHIVGQILSSNKLDEAPLNAKQLHKLPPAEDLSPGCPSFQPTALGCNSGLKLRVLGCSPGQVAGLLFASAAPLNVRSRAVLSLWHSRVLSPGLKQPEEFAP